MESATQVQILDESYYILLCVIALGRKCLLFKANSFRSFKRNAVNCCYIKLFIISIFEHQMPCGIKIITKGTWCLKLSLVMSQGQKYVALSKNETH